VHMQLRFYPPLSRNKQLCCRLIVMLYCCSLIKRSSEEMEASIMVDVLRRAGAEVTVASVEADLQVDMAHTNLGPCCVQCLLLSCSCVHVA